MQQYMVRIFLPQDGHAHVWLLNIDVLFCRVKMALMARKENLGHLDQWFVYFTCV